MDERSKAMQAMIPSLASATDIHRITEGFSSDHKYLVRYHNGQKLLLRTADIAHYERKSAEYHIMRSIKPYGAKSPLPLEFGKVEALGLCYYLLSYIEGEDARKTLPTYTTQEQYRIGWEAGRDLERLHQLPAPPSTPDWYDHIMKKHDRYLTAYQTCGVKLENDRQIIRFIEENEYVLKDRPNQFQHDDFHVGNIIVNERAYAGIIDFNRYDWGDPLFDFSKLALFSKECSVPFAKGQIDGYFAHQPIPEHFWTLYAIYAAMSVFSAIVWSVKETPDKVEEMRQRLHNLCVDHQYFESCIPVWYSNGLKE
ncbi:aminoglycoside phosphotransferase family protein [Brevibacillus ruminantium]|uniref:Aminoglycoside phosphotransferase family protein n=1 Tax=Brevibacillus ruminantium TaxID=2950604 RepID=A0ABY4WM58_9BACL|nr:aminoglycoside phosphotransferase family protein [Brevibacillus ruminantium]USG68232.1 aminoglycoside phosphotransferase family protein [Brevibacillus ruminantium]